MLYKTKGVVLHTVPYNDKQIIVSMFTEVFGRASYIIINSKGKRTGVSRSLLAPLSILDMEVDHANNRNIHHIREARLSTATHSIACNPVKNAVALFLSETLYRLLNEKEPDAALFNFLCNSIRYLEITETGIANFHIAFLFQLSDYLGIHPKSDTFRQNRYFDLLNGVFTDDIPSHSFILNINESRVFGSLLRISYENMALFSFSRGERTEIISHILDYYRLHIYNFPEIRSLAVLQELFN
ncbi:MAG: DNA repair protein RecO [Tannerella sp.]|jgi:DNA repair protein RecO (recombination protein O)|nr:DNA repair protein RecO [Tannerella sp.]